MKTKILVPIMLLSLIVASPVTSVSATTVTAPGVQSVPVTANVEETYTVTLPTGIAIGDSRKAEYTVKVAGDVLSTTSITVTPAASFNLDQGSKHVEATVTQLKTSWNYSEITAGAGAGTPATGTQTTGEVAAPNLTAGDWRGNLSFNVEIAHPLTLTAGETYTLGGYDWVAAEVNEGYVTLQSTGVTGGEWPGYKMASFGNGASYTSNIDGQDISTYDDKTIALYNSIKSAEYSGASYGTGLFLVSNEKVGTTTGGSLGSGNYWTALNTAITNYSSFGASSSCAWLGTVRNSDSAWFVSSTYGVHYNNGQSGLFVIAPAFNLDISKVTLEGHTLTIK